MASIGTPPRDRLTVDVHQDGNALVVRPAGELDMATNDVLEKDLLDAFESSATSIVLDLDGLTFIDSSGLRLLVSAANRAGEDGDRLRIHCEARAVRRMIELTGLDRALPLAA